MRARSTTRTTGIHQRWNDRSIELDLDRARRRLIRLLRTMGTVRMAANACTDPSGSPTVGPSVLLLAVVPIPRLSSSRLLTNAAFVSMPLMVLLKIPPLLASVEGFESLSNCCGSWVVNGSLKSNIDDESSILSNVLAASNDELNSLSEGDPPPERNDWLADVSNLRTFCSRKSVPSSWRICSLLECGRLNCDAAMFVPFPAPALAPPISLAFADTGGCISDPSSARFSVLPVLWLLLLLPVLPAIGSDEPGAMRDFLSCPIDECLPCCECCCCCWCEPSSGLKIDEGLLCFGGVHICIVSAGRPNDSSSSRKEDDSNAPWECCLADPCDPVCCESVAD
uniref:Uncharacterized protein n=1 Tax=Anopheles atroparvus TaxID=41427 RepID=A0A182IRA7_ANOAO